MFNHLPQQELNIGKKFTGVFFLKSKFTSVTEDSMTNMAISIEQGVVALEDFVTEEECRAQLATKLLEAGQITLPPDNLKTDVISRIKRFIRNIFYAPKLTPATIEIERVKNSIARKTRRGFGKYFEDESMIAYIGSNMMDSGIIIALHEGKFALYFADNWKDYFVRVAHAE